jgi:hypothetical protein
VRPTPSSNRLTRLRLDARLGRNHWLRFPEVSEGFNAPLLNPRGKNLIRSDSSGPLSWISKSRTRSDKRQPAEPSRLLNGQCQRDTPAHRVAQDLRRLEAHSLTKGFDGGHSIVHLTRLTRIASRVSWQIEGKHRAAESPFEKACFLTASREAMQVDERR